MPETPQALLFTSTLFRVHCYLQSGLTMGTGFDRRHSYLDLHTICHSSFTTFQEQRQAEANTSRFASSSVALEHFCAAAMAEVHFAEPRPRPELARSCRRLSREPIQSRDLSSMPDLHGMPKREQAHCNTSP